MKHEYEAKFLSVNVEYLQTRLKTLGAVQAFPRTLLTRKIFENDALDGGAWVRLRDEGTRSTLTLKQVTDSTTIDGTTEIETEVADLGAMAEILSRLGLAEVRYQENFREEWRWGDVAFDFDTWPGLPTFVEIEGPDEAAVRQAAATLGLDYTQARFGSVDEIYKSELGRDILAEPTLLFANTNDDGEPLMFPVAADVSSCGAASSSRAVPDNGKLAPTASQQSHSAEDCLRQPHPARSCCLHGKEWCGQLGVRTLGARLTGWAR